MTGRERGTDVVSDVTWQNRTTDRRTNTPSHVRMQHDVDTFLFEKGVANTWDALFDDAMEDDAS